jgi:monoamine oxidase
MVIIVGAGLSGLLTAYRLKKAGIPVKVLEGRDRVGGRIYTKITKDESPVEMGATWFRPEHTNLISLLSELNLPFSEQHLEGKVYFQAFSTAPAESISIPPQGPSYRIAGGTASIISKLSSLLSPEELEIGEMVSKVELSENTLRVTAGRIIECEKIVIALPPKLGINLIEFNPNLPQNLIQIAQNTHTWMEDSIKVALTFPKPFWREDGKSGALFSNVGPVTEFYDHCNTEETKYALCGFVNNEYALLSFDDRKKKILNQLNEIYGQEVLEYIDYQESVWADENFTSFPSDQPLFPHQNNGNPIFNRSFFEGRVFFSNTETSSVHGGYMEGAVHAANSVSKKLITN